MWSVDDALLRRAREALEGREDVFWLLGAAGAGKTTVSGELCERFDFARYDMDAHIYGAYHRRFTRERHPANTAWAEAPSSLRFLLGMPWEEFDAFHRAAGAEYLDLFVDELRTREDTRPLLVDGGLWHPSLLTPLFDPMHVVCLQLEGRRAARVWSPDGDRGDMHEMVTRAADTEDAWRRFLEADDAIARVLREECEEHGVPILRRRSGSTPGAVADEVARALGLSPRARPGT
jgi:hypothetical protein